MGKNDLPTTKKTKAFCCNDGVHSVVPRNCKRTYTIFLDRHPPDYESK